VVVLTERKPDAVMEDRVEKEPRVKSRVLMMEDDLDCDKVGVEVSEPALEDDS
jgi:hypothetical protein